MLSFTLLGQTALHNNGQPLSQMRSKKEPALLIYLAQTGRMFSREFIAELLWDERSTQQSSSNLRTVLTRLRKQVGDDLLITRDSLTLAPESRRQIDSVHLLQNLSSVRQVDSAEQAASVQDVLNTFQGDFLANFGLADAPQFDAWVITTRQHIRNQVLAAYEKLGNYALATHNVEFGLDTARRWLQVDTLDEAAHTLMIRLLLEAGNTREAVAHYDNCANLLRAELSIEPPTEMKVLLKDVRPQPRYRGEQSTLVRHNLPAVYNQFFGRDDLQQMIGERLNQPWCRLITLMGPGGVGKTRLSTTIARSRLKNYADGVWFIDLTNVNPDDDNLIEAIAVEIATEIDLRLTGSTKPIEQLLDHLQHKTTLLVLDNFENLLEATPLLLEIIQRCQNVQMLVTSRESLHLRAEWAVAVAGLSYPTDDNPQQSDAVDLFWARLEQRKGKPAESEQAAINTICRLVEGLPLAIELAAAMAHETHCTIIAERLRTGFDSLAATLRDVPQRHRSLQILFDSSWQALTPVLQKRLTNLSPFRGGFTAAAAQQIAEATPDELRQLCEKSLLSYDSAQERYTFHAVIQTYAAQKLLTPEILLQNHARYYLELLAHHTQTLQKSEPQQSIATIHADIDNVRLAWQTSLATPESSRPVTSGLLLSALTSLSIYYQLRGLAHEAEAVMHNTVHSAVKWGPTGVQLAARAGLEQARFQNRLGRCRAAIESVKLALSRGNQHNDEWLTGMGHVLWGESLWRLGEYDLSMTKLTHALTIAQAIDNTLLIGWSHHHLGIIDDIQSRYPAALAHLQQASAAWRSVENMQALCGTLNSIGSVYVHQGNWQAARQALEQALTLCENLDDRHRQSMLINNLSTITMGQGDYSSAQKYLERSLGLAVANGDWAAQGLAYTNLGRNYRFLGKAALAIKNLEEGLQIGESTGNRTLTATAMVYLADAKCAQEEPDRAEPLYRQALDIARQDSLRYIECEALIGMAEFFCKKHEHEASEYSTQALSLAETLQNPNLVERALAVNQRVSQTIN